MTLFPINIESATEIFKELDLFSKISGLRCNQDKTEALRLGKCNIDHGNGLQVKWVKEITITGVIFTEFGIDIDKNVGPIPKKIESQLQKWNAQQISLLGRSQIIKTFGFSQIRFLSNIMTLPLETINMIKSQVFNFLWNGSERGKVKRRAITADYDKGGVRFPDLDSIISAQHIGWIKRFLFSPDHSWKAIFTWQMEKLGGSHILENKCLDVQSIQEHSLMTHYKYILISWGNFNHMDITQENVLEQQIFMNRHIVRPNKQTIFYPSLIQKGIIYIKDIVRDGRVHTAEEMRLNKQLNVTEFMQYISILQCLDARTKQLINTVTVTDNPLAPYQINDLRTMKPKRIYEKILTKSIERPTSEEKLNSLMSTSFNIDDWKLIYKMPFLSTIESKLRSFQFKINHNIYYTNEKLLMVKKSETDKCYFCEQETETLIHFFIKCPKVLMLWRYINIIISRTHQIGELTTPEKIIGMHTKVEQPEYDIINHLIIVIKHFIHICKHKKTEPSIPGLISKILDTEAIEKIIAEKKNKKERHDFKWKAFLDELSATQRRTQIV